MNSLRVVLVKRPFLFQLLFSLIVATAFRAVTVVAQEVMPLERGKSVTRTLSGGEPQAYSLTLAAGQYLHVIVEQLGTDLAVTLYAPDGKKLADYDNAFEDQGPEQLYWVAESTGVYRLEIRTSEKDAAAGRYEIKLAAVRIATELDRKRVTAELAFAEAEKSYEENKSSSYRLSIKQYELAFPLFLELGEQPRAATCHNHLGNAYSKVGDQPQALAHFNQALQLFQALKDRVAESAVWHNLGVVHQDLGESHKAVENYTHALKLRREVKDREGEANTLNSLGVLYRSLGERKKALEHYLLSLQIRRELKDRAGEAITLNNLGVLYDELGEVQQMLDAYTQALPLRREPLQRAITLDNIGRGYERLGLPQEALQNYQQALPLVRTVGNALWEARTLNFMGLAYGALGEYATARAHFEQTLPLYQAAKNTAGEAAARNNLGLVYDALKQPAQAVSAYQQALALSRAAKNRQAEAAAYNNLGFAYERLRDLSKAADAHQQALQLSRAIGDRQREVKSLYGCARIARAQGRLKQSRTQIEQALAFVESLPAKLNSPELRMSYRATTAPYYEFYVDLLMQMRRQPRGERFVALALQASEQARARSLLEMLQESGTDLRSEVAADLVAREHELQQKLLYKAAQQLLLANDPATTTRAASLASEVEQLTAALRDAQAELRRASPQYAALTQPQPLGLRELQQQVLDRQTLLLEYFLGEERSYVWAVTSDTLTGYVLPPRAVIEPLARQYYELLTDPGGPGKQAALLPVAVRLSRLLLPPPVAASRSKRLLIVADGALQYVPFAALPEPVVGGRWPGAGAWQQVVKDKGQVGSLTGHRPPATAHRPLLVRHEIVTLPSASTLASLRRAAAGRAAATKAVAVLADPVFEAKDERVKTVTVGAGKPAAVAPVTATAARLLFVKKGSAPTAATISRLPHTRREAETILSLVKPTESVSAYDFAANREAIFRPELGAARILHLATHGFLNPLHPALSGLVLSLVNEQGQAQNGFLLAPEIYQLKLPATELVVLSACQTGLGQEVRGEGVVGLTRGFMYAGAPRVVVSLWNVSDEATAELMKQFYTAMLRRGLRPAAALRAAQLTLWKQARWQAPYYWAAFGLQGDWR